MGAKQSYSIWPNKIVINNTILYWIDILLILIIFLKNFKTFHASNIA